MELLIPFAIANNKYVMQCYMANGNGATVKIFFFLLKIVMVICLTALSI